MSGLRAMLQRAAAALALALCAWQRLVTAAPHPSNMHTVFLADCSDYFQWQSVGMYYSHQKSGQPGPVTRVMCCEPNQAKHINQVRCVTMQGRLVDPGAICAAWRSVLNATRCLASCAHASPQQQSHTASCAPCACLAQPGSPWWQVERVHGLSHT
jgi:hypothetical protein